MVPIQCICSHRNSFHLLRYVGDLLYDKKTGKHTDTAFCLCALLSSCFSALLTTRMCTYWPTYNPSSVSHSMESSCSISRLALRATTVCWVRRSCWKSQIKKKNCITSPPQCTPEFSACIPVSSICSTTPVIVMALTLHAPIMLLMRCIFFLKVTRKISPVFIGCCLSPVGPAAHTITGTQQVQGASQSV